MNSLVSSLRGNDASGGYVNRGLQIRPSCRLHGRSCLGMTMMLAGVVLAGCVNVSSVTAQVNVRVETISGAPIHGTFLKLTGTQLRLRDEAGVVQSIDTAGILRISATDFDEIRVPQISKTPWILLATGDRLRMAPLVIDDEQIVARWAEYPTWPPVSLPLELCRSVVMSIASSPVEQSRSFRRILDHHEHVDRITLSNGDRVDGEFVGLQDEKFTLTTTIGKVQTDIAQTRSLAFNPELVSDTKVDGESAILTLSDGSTLYVRKIVSDDAQIIAESIGGFEFSIPVTAFRSIRFHDAVRVDLTRLTPNRSTITPFLSIAREPQTNRNVIGGFMSQRGQLIAVGFGLTSGTELSWKLDRKYGQFQASVGIDDSALGAGNAIFEVLVDGKVAWESDTLTGSSELVIVPSIDLSDADELTLRVKYGDRGSVLDYANWCEPILIRKPQETAN
ncbi:MAG: NPCBM/NEW2 domain-containing protein [Planctomycetota bacterium]|nr:NPCBM/NEW2 domain-containing protein [Planctomycetota bacterium]